MTEKQQRDFLKAVAGENEPSIFTDTSGTFTVFLSGLRFSSPHKHVRGAEEIAELTLAEASGGPWTGALAGTQAEFLRQCAQDIEPLLYDAPDGRAWFVILTRMSWQTPYKGSKGAEPVVQLRMVDMWQVDEWTTYSEAVGVAETLTALSIWEPTDVSRYDTAQYGFGMYG